MPIQIIQDKVEECFLTMLGNIHRTPTGSGAILCRFSHTSLTVDADSVVALLKPLLDNHDGSLYFFRDGDIAVCWSGQVIEMTSAVTGALTDYYQLLRDCDPRVMFRFFDPHAHGEDLRLLIRSKLEAHLPHKEKVQELPMTHESEFTHDQLHLLQQAKIRRVVRKDPEFLIVEDQDFSRKLLASVFELNYRCHLARNGQQAVALYAEHAPDITFLDIELPDADGHSLAALIKKHDPESYIIMVTGNHYAKDVDTAKANKVQGFVAKPYNRQKIMAAVDLFMNRKKEG